MAWGRASGKPPERRSVFGEREGAAAAPALAVNGLDVYYGRAHALQEVSFVIQRGITAIVGRNGMGKTTLCNAITGLVRATGSVKLHGEEILGLAPNEVTRRGIAYVPQGRRVWPSLSVEETLRLVARHKREVERVYEMFPRLAERKDHGGAQLSGGEQQMLAIGRALLLEPRLLVMDEPTEGLAPLIVEQVEAALRQLGSGDELAVLLIEQNIGVAIDVADRIGVMVNGRIAHEMSAQELAADRALQERLLGVHSNGDDEAAAAPSQAPALDAPTAEGTVQVLTVRRAHADGAPSLDAGLPTAVRGLNRWNAASATPAPVVGLSRETPRETPRDTPREPRPEPAPSAQVLPFPVAGSSGRAAYVAGTFDTKGRELFFLRQCLEKLGVRVVTVDLSTSGKPSPASVHPREVARHHPDGERAVFSDDRGRAVSAMALAFERFVQTRRDLGGLISAGGSGGTTLATQAMRALPVGCPKVMVSTMASGDTRPYVGPSDICMMYSVTDVQGIHRISEKVLANAAHALAGMITHPAPESEELKPAIGLTMFGVTTPCVQRGDEAPGRHPRLPRLPCHRRRRPVDGEAGRLRPAGRRDRRHHHRGGRRDRRRRAVGRADAARRVRAPPAAVRRLVRRARHGQLRRLGHGARALPIAQALPPQPGRHVDAHHGRRMPHDRAVHRRQAERDDRPGALPDPRRRRVRHRPAGPALPRPRRRPRAVRGHRAAVSTGREPQARAPADARERRGLRRRAGGGVARGRRAA